MVETGHLPSWPRIERRSPCDSSSHTCSTVPGFSVGQDHGLADKLCLGLLELGENLRCVHHGCNPAWGPNADRRPNCLIDFVSVGSMFGSDSDLMMFSAELAILQRGNQDHASRHSNFVACAEWVGYRERK